jgi:serine/threonine protein kinase
VLTGRNLPTSPTEVGTRLYIAPEVQSPKGGLRGTAKADMTKADMYSLGVRVVFLSLRGS